MKSTISSFLFTFLLCASVHAQVNFINDSLAIDFDRNSTIFCGDGLAGAAWLDYDNDGWMDVYLTNGKGQNNGLFRNNGDGTFTDVSTFAGVTNGLGNSAALAGDIDNDGWTDIFLSGDGGMMCSMGTSPVAFYRNNGDGTFTDITASSGVTGGISHLSSAFGDINNDGYLDLFISACGSLVGGILHENTFYLNNGDLTFTPLAVAELTDSAKGACIAFFSDQNGDGLQDLFVGNCNNVLGSTSNPEPGEFELYLNNGDLTFDQLSYEIGFSDGLWMGVAPFDIENDGDIDIFLTNSGKSWPGAVSKDAIFQNNGDGTYTNISVPTGVDTLEWGWGAVSDDYDNDGFQDLFFTGSMPVGFNVIDTGLCGGERVPSPGRVMFNNGDATFSHYIPKDMSCLFTSGVSAADYDRNGFPDIMVNLEPWGAAEGQPILLQNQGNGNNWICIKLVGDGSTVNKAAIGSMVTVDADGFGRTKEIYAGSSFASSNSPWLNFGLGSTTIIDETIVRWPNGTFDSIPGNMMTINTCNTIEQGGTVTTSIASDQLLQESILAYPNPSNGNTTISFTLTEATKVGLSIVDITGREVRLIQSEMLTPGAHSIQFDGMNNGGIPLATGTYFFRLNTSNKKAGGTLIIIE